MTTALPTYRLLVLLIILTMLLATVIPSRTFMVPANTWKARTPLSSFFCRRIAPVFHSVLSTSRPTVFPSTTGSTYYSMSTFASSLPATTSTSTTSNIENTPSNNSNNGNNQNSSNNRIILQSTTGGLRSLPVVKAPIELINRSRKVAYLIKSDKNIKNIRNRARKHGAETINALIQALCIPLRDTVTGYKYVYKKLHPFEQVVFDLSVKARQQKDGLTLYEVLDEIHDARKIILETGKEWIYKIKQAGSAKEASVTMEEGIQQLILLFEQLASKPVTDLLEIQRSLRSAPVVDLDTPAVVLVGAPNVGKSSIVRAISSAKPEINNYPFTTRGMTLGHVEVFWSNPTTIAKAVVPDKESSSISRKQRKSISPEVVIGKYAFSQLCQIMDSPGLLVRPDNERNEMEALTLAAMQHLPTAVMYVMDLSGSAGDKCSSVTDQLLLRKEMRSRFPRRPWIDVVSKIDLGVVEGSLEQLQDIIGKDTPYIQLSLHEGIGLNELKSEVLRMLGDVRLVLDAIAAVSIEQDNNDL